MVSNFRFCNLKKKKLLKTKEINKIILDKKLKLTYFRVLKQGSSLAVQQWVIPFIRTTGEDLTAVPAGKGTRNFCAEEVVTRVCLR